MKQKQKKSYIKLLIQFLKLQAAGNILFWGTYLGFFLLHEVYHWEQTPALATASIIAHILFFLVDRQWVFADKTGRRKTSSEIRRFLIFMGFNYFLNLGIIEALSHYYDLSPYYGQFVAAAFFTVWNYVGLRFWVFHVPQRTDSANDKQEQRTMPDAANRPSKKQRELLSFIDGFIKGHGYGPSYREVMRALNYKSVSTVATHIDGLIKKGCLIKKDHSARSLVVVSADTNPQTAIETVTKTQEKWLVDQVMRRFALYESEPHEKLYDELCILTGTLTVLGLQDAATAAKTKLAQIK